jgi:hypothetical protein
MFWSLFLPFGMDAFQVHFWRFSDFLAGEVLSPEAAKADGAIGRVI